jgi:signal transduction histidine kinase
LILETFIIDSGQGIPEKRKELLFIPFKELRELQGLVESNNNNIGLGLGGSYTLARYLGGDITLRQSAKGLTVISFKIPVRIEDRTEMRGDELRILLETQSRGMN